MGLFNPQKRLNANHNITSFNYGKTHNKLWLLLLLNNREGNPLNEIPLANQIWPKNRRGQSNYAKEFECKFHTTIQNNRIKWNWTNEFLDWEMSPNPHPIPSFDCTLNERCMCGFAFYSHELFVCVCLFCHFLTLINKIQFIFSIPQYITACPHGFLFIIFYTCMCTYSAFQFV